MKAKLAIVWFAIVGVAGALLFPPYGYSKYNLLVVAGGNQSESVKNVEWRYVGNNFILSGAPSTKDDPLIKSLTGTSQDVQVVASAANLEIYWIAVAIEIAVIILLAVGLFATIVLVNKRGMAKEVQLGVQRDGAR